MSSVLMSWISPEWIMQTGLAVTVLIVLVLLVRRPFAKIFGAGAAYALWSLPVMRVFMPNITVPRIFPELPSELTPKVISVVQPIDLMLLQPEILNEATKPSFFMQLLPFIIGLWLTGAAAYFLYQWLRQAAQMDRLVYMSEPAIRLTSAIHSAAKVSGLKHIPRVKIADDNSGPLVSGVLNPVVILPSDFEDSFTHEQQYYALIHEFTHIKRGDLFVALGGLVFRALNWPNPLVHYAAKHFRSDQEAACDATVLKVMGGGQKTLSEYAETLVHAAMSAAQNTSKTGRASPQLSQLALTIHHPLKERLMILGTHKKTVSWRSRTAAAVMIIGAAALSAPLTQATSHPEEALAGKPEIHKGHQGKSVIKRKYTKDGKMVSEHFEINVDGDDITAYKVGPFGKKTRVDVEDIEDLDVKNILVENIEGGNSHSVTISDGDGVKVMSRSEFKKWAETEYPEWKEQDFDSWVEGDMAAWVAKTNKGKLSFHSKDGKHFELHNFPHPPKPPFPLKFSKHSENVFVLDSDDFPELKSLKKLESLKGLKGLKKLEALKRLEGLDGLAALDGLDALDDIETFTVFSDGGDKLRLKMHRTESKLAAARAMLENTEIEVEGTSREMAKAKRELEKARKALKAAEQALKDAE